MMLRREIMKQLSVTIVVLHIPNTEIIIPLSKLPDLAVLLYFLSASAWNTSITKKNTTTNCAAHNVAFIREYSHRDNILNRVLI